MARPVIRAALLTAVAAAAAGATGALAAPPPGHGHGSIKAALQPTTTLLPSQCAAATTGPAKGFAVLNAPGAPGATPGNVLGTVSLKRAAEKNTAFEVDLAIGGACVDTGAVLTTNTTGNGTAHFAMPLPDNADTDVYVVLKKAPIPQLSALPLGVEAYASKAVRLS
jgi:hypothetical protein